MADTPEAKVKKQIKTYLKSLHPNMVEFSPIAGRFASIGVSDIICCINGRFVALEVKAPGGKATPLQLDFIRRVREAGGIAGVVESTAQVALLLLELAI